MGAFAADEGLAANFISSPTVPTIYTPAVAATDNALLAREVGAGISEANARVRLDCGRRRSEMAAR
jgi:hypothetical protein